MSDFGDTTAAAAEFAEGFTGDTPAAPVAPTPPATPGTTTAPETNNAPEPTQAEVESFLQSVDPSTLTGENLILYRSMQADYTRKMQGIADERKKFSALGDDVDYAANAVTFARRLEQGDPEVIAALKAAFADFDNGETATPNNGDDGYDDEAPADLNSLKAQLAAEFEAKIEAFKAEQAEAVALQAATQELQTKLNTLQKSYNYSDEDMDVIQRLAFTSGADINKANDMFIALGQRLVNSAIVPTNTPPAPASTNMGLTNPSTKFDSLEDPKLFDAAKAALLATGEFTR